jgi:type IV pilus assembly protein PilW
MTLLSAAKRCHRHRARSRGFSLIELMIAMLLGLIVIGGVTSVFLAGRQSYRSNEALSDVQDSSRVAYEMVARDIRDAGVTACNNNGRVANVLNDSGTDWYADWDNALHGYDASADASGTVVTQADPAVATGTTQGARIAGTDSVQVLSAGGLGLTVAETPSDSAANFKINETTNDLVSGDLVMICDPDHATMVQVTKLNGSNVTLVHNKGSSTTPGNCTKGLGYPTVCSANGTSYTFKKNAQISKLTAADWYIGSNPDGGRSLYRKSLSTAGENVGTTTQEMIRNVWDMQITYLQPGATSFVAGNLITNWETVSAVRIALTVRSTNQRAGTDAKPLERTFMSTTTVRNRVL